jgi:hypothetical protein
MNIYYTYFAIFFCVAYLIITDQSVAKGFYMLTQLAKNNFQVFIWWLMNNPKMPWVRYSMHRRSMKLAEELMKEFQEKNK